MPTKGIFIPHKRGTYQGFINMYINKGKTMRKLYNMIALVLFSSLMFAQSVSGTVTDADGNALFGANVTIEGTSSGAATGADG